MTTGQNGFIASRSLGSKPVLVEFEIASAAIVFAGDMLELNSSGLVIPATAASAPLGVCHSVYKKTADGKPKPLTFNLPSNGPFKNGGDGGFALVNVSREQRYIVSVDTSASAGLIGKNFKVSAGTPNSAAGISGMSLSKTYTTSADAGQVRCMSVAPTELLDRRSGDVNASKSGIEVQLIPALSAFGRASGT